MRVVALIVVLALAVVFALRGGPPAAGAEAARTAVNDFNGDGFSDLLLPGSGGPPGASLVVLLGRSAPVDVQTSALTPSTGYRMLTGGEIGSYQPLGDVDGDGYADVEVSVFPRTGQRRTVTVYGHAATGDVDLDQPSPDVVPSAERHTPVGDVNGDGLADLAFVNQHTNRVTVLLGRRARRRPGHRGMSTTVAFRGNIHVAAAGDADGDGLDDLAVVYDDYYEDLMTETVYGGPVFVVAGRRGSATVEIADRTDDGYPVRLRGSHRRAGYAAWGWIGNVPGAPGDFDGDGRDDLLVTGPQYGGPGLIVHGRSATAFSDRAARHLTRISGTPIGNDAGAPVGDFDGDGLADVVMSVTRIYGGTQTGRLAVVLGRRRRGTIDRRRRDDRTWRLVAPAGVRLAPSGPLGDFNGDRYADFLLTEDRDDELPGRRYVVLGGRARPPEQVAALGARGIVIE